MIYPVPFRAEHFAAMKVQRMQQWMAETATVETLRVLENEYSGTTMMDGKPIAIAGVWPQWEGRAFLWSVMSDEITARNFLTVHRMALKALDGLPFKRLEMAVDVGFDAGHRWAKALGFTMEAPCMKAFQASGADASLYARVRET